MSSSDRRIEWNWIDRVSFVNADHTQLRAHRLLEPREWYFEHHFEHFAVLPGVLLIEIMAHASAYLQILRVWRSTSELTQYFLAGVNNARFYRHVTPGSAVDLIANHRGGDEEHALMQIDATVDDRRVARTEVILQRTRTDWVDEQLVVLRKTLDRVISAELKDRYRLL